MEPRKTSSVIHALRARELGSTRNSYRHNLKIMSNLIKQERVMFKQCWSRTAKKPIIYDDGKIFFENYKECYTLCGTSGKPTKIFSLNLKGRKRIVDALIYTAPIHKTMVPPSEYKPLLLAVTEDNWLLRYDNKTGQLLQEIFLGAEYKFRHIDWETHGETFFLQSVEQPRSTILQVMVLFKIFPLQLVGAFQIEKEVFGNDIKSANQSEGLLIVGAGSGLNRTVRLYGLSDVFSESNFKCNCQLGDCCGHFGETKIKVGMDGVPINVKVEDRPPLLFEARCSEEIIFFGGYPWHYIYSPSKQKGVFKLKNLETHELVESGTFDLENNSTEPDTLTFHVDDTGRLVYTSAHEITFYKLINNIATTSVVKQFALSIRPSNNPEAGPSIASTSSPELYTPRRRLNKRKNYAEDLTDRTILTDDYENELEFYLLLGLDTSVVKKNGRILIFNNATGELVKEVNTGLTLCEESEHTLIMDMDTLILIVKDVAKASWTVHVYRMSSEEQEREQLARRKQKPGKLKPRNCCDSDDDYPLFNPNVKTKAS